MDSYVFSPLCPTWKFLTCVFFHHESARISLLKNTRYVYVRMNEWRQRQQHSPRGSFINYVGWKLAKTNNIQGITTPPTMLEPIPHFLVIISVRFPFYPKNWIFHSYKKKIRIQKLPKIWKQCDRMKNIYRKIIKSQKNKRQPTPI